MPTPRTDTHAQLAEAMGDREWQESELCALLNKPQQAIRSTLRGMVRRGEARVIKPAKLPAPFRYKLVPRKA